MASGSRLHYACDGDRVLAEYDFMTGTPVLLRYYIDGPTYVDEHILVHDALAGNEYYYLLKELYTVAGLADQSGNIAEAYNYDAYGRVALFDAAGQPIGASAAGNPYFFTGRRLDQFQANAPPFYHYRARSYDPLHGRFLQRDPLGYVDGMNLYEYARSRPTLVVDPSGERTQVKIKTRHCCDWRLPNGQVVSIAEVLQCAVQDTCEWMWNMQRTTEAFEGLGIPDGWARVTTCIRQNQHLREARAYDYVELLNKVEASACRGEPREFICKANKDESACQTARKPAMVTKPSWRGAHHGQAIVVCTDNLHDPTKDLTRIDDMLHELLRWFVGDPLFGGLSPIYQARIALGPGGMLERCTDEVSRDPEKFRPAPRDPIPGLDTPH